MGFSDWTLGRATRTGAMGTVWRATHAPSGTPAALKFVPPRPGQPFARIAQEVAAHARLCHPHIVGLYDFGVTPPEAPDGPGSLWIAMEWLEGGDCAHHRPKTWETVERYLLQLLSALAQAHALRIIHRDIKPANLLLNARRDRLLLADFGLSLRRSAGRTRSGTPVYMAPEQIDGASWQGPWTDLYAMAGVVWHWLTGVPPAQRDTVEQTLAAQRNDEPAFFYPQFEVPDGVEAWLRRCLAKNPLERFQSAGDALVALGHARPLLAPVPHPPSLGSGVAALWPMRMPPLIGREEEFARLTAAAGESGLDTIAVTGCEGSGRRHLLEHVQGALRIVGSHPVLRLSDAGPRGVRQGLRQLLGDLDPGWLSRCAHHHGCTELLPSWLGFLSAPQQASDPLSLLARSVNAVASTVVVFCSSRCGSEVHAVFEAHGLNGVVVGMGNWPSATTTVALEPLGPDAVVEWARVTLGDASRARQAFRETGGVPGELASWLAHREGVGFHQAGPDARAWSQNVRDTALLLALLPPPGSPSVLRAAAKRQGVSGVDAALVYLARENVVHAEGDHLIVSLTAREAIIRYAGHALNAARDAMGTALAADPSCALDAATLLAHSSPLAAWGLLRTRLTTEIPAAGLGERADSVRPHLPSSEQWVAQLVSVANSHGEGADEETFTDRVETVLEAVRRAGQPVDAVPFVLAMRIESLCHNTYRLPALAERVAQAVDELDQDARGWGCILLSMAPWRRSEREAASLLRKGVACAQRAGDARAESVARVQLAQLLLEWREEEQEALEHLRQAVRLQPERTTFRVVLAGALRERDGEAYDAALEAAYLEGWKLRPKLWNWVRLCRCERWLDRRGEGRSDRTFEAELVSLERSTSALGQRVQRAQCALLLAVYHAEVGQLEHAQAAWSRFDEHAPPDWAEPRVTALIQRLQRRAPTLPVQGRLRAGA